MHLRVMCLLSVSQISLEELFFYELPPVPLSMSTVTEEGRLKKKNTAALKNKIKIEVSKRNAAVDLTNVDGCVELY